MAKYKDMQLPSSCRHLYDPVCTDCGQDATLKWITCSRYKSDCPDFACVTCGEFDSRDGSK